MAFVTNEGSPERWGYFDAGGDEVLAPGRDDGGEALQPCLAQHVNVGRIGGQESGHAVTAPVSGYLRTKRRASARSTAGSRASPRTTSTAASGTAVKLAREVLSATIGH